MHKIIPRMSKSPKNTFHKPILIFRISFDNINVHKGSVKTIVSASPIGMYKTQANWNNILAPPNSP